MTAKCTVGQNQRTVLVHGVWPVSTHLAFLLELDLEVVLVASVGLHFGAVQTLWIMCQLERSPPVVSRAMTYLDVVRNLLRVRQAEVAVVDTELAVEPLDPAEGAKNRQD